MSKQEATIPKQRTGGKSNTEASVTLASVSDACDHFELVKERFMNINAWGKLSKGMADFQLTDWEGREKNGIAEEGDHIRINLPAPGTISSGEFEWVSIEYIVHKRSIMSDFESLAILVRPSENPMGDKKVTAHFFKEDATSTFMIRRDNNKITAEVHGRNEKPNTNVHYFLDKLRNMLVSIAAILGFSKVQWKLLVKGLVNLDDEPGSA